MTWHVISALHSFAFFNEINSMKLAILIWFGVIVKVTNTRTTHTHTLRKREKEKRNHRSKEKGCTRIKVQSAHFALFLGIYSLALLFSVRVPFSAFSIDQSMKRSNLINWWEELNNVNVYERLKFPMDVSDASVCVSTAHTWVQACTMCE